MILIAVRHGETEWNLQGREQGHLDSTLTERGAKQAHALARRLSSIHFHALYSSDLGRAVQTAEIIASVCGKQVQLDPGLRERHMGTFQGLTQEEMRRKYPKEQDEYERTGFFHTVAGGESATERLERSAKVFTNIAERHANQTVIGVTHGGFLMGFLEHVLGLPFGNGWRFKKQNASFNAFEYVNSTWSLQTWNDLSHLNGLSTLVDPSIHAG